MVRRATKLVFGFRYLKYPSRLAKIGIHTLEIRKKKRKSKPNKTSFQNCQQIKHCSSICLHVFTDSNQSPTSDHPKMNGRKNQRLKTKMVLLDNEQFLSELTKFYQKSKTSGTVLVSMKRYDGRTKPVPRTEKKNLSQIPEPQEYKCLMRASIGSKKISTVVSAKDINKFQLAYSNLIRGNIELKKKEKKCDKTSQTKKSGKTSQQS